MATLIIKGLPDRLYKQLQARAKKEHRSVAQEVVYMLRQALEAPLGCVTGQRVAVAIGQLSRT
jgi:plasmid stability protein